MNAKQRRKEKRKTLRMAAKLMKVMTESLEDIESGKYSVAEVKDQVKQAKKELLEI